MNIYAATRISRPVRPLRRFRRGRPDRGRTAQAWL